MTKKIKVGINGFGRIGRTIFRKYVKEHYKNNSYEIEIVAINNPGDHEKLIHLLNFDSTHGRFKTETNNDAQLINSDLVIDRHNPIKLYQEYEPEKIPWDDTGVEVVIDSTGIFKTGDQLRKHMDNSNVKKVVLSAPGQDIDGTFVMGVNDDKYNKDQHHIVSNASCTTNCLSPVAKIINDNFTVLNGTMSTIHAYTSDQRLIDAEHKDPRRGRSAAQSIIPTTTGAAKAVGLVLPELQGKLHGMAYRVPTANVSVVDVSFLVEKETTKEEVNKLIKEAAQGAMKGVLDAEDRPLVSIDYNGNTHSSIVDLSLTEVQGNIVKIVTWYDNESGYSNRVLDLCKILFK